MSWGRGIILLITMTTKCRMGQRSPHYWSETLGVATHQYINLIQGITSMGAQYHWSSKGNNLASQPPLTYGKSVLEGAGSRDYESINTKYIVGGGKLELGVRNPRAPLNEMHSCRFLDTVHTLSKEAGPALGQWEVCDNMDLTTVLQEYEAYCFVKFNKFPKIARRRVGNGKRERDLWHSRVVLYTFKPCMMS